MTMRYNLRRKKQKCRKKHWLKRRGNDSMKNNIIIAGVPRAGKSTVAHLLARRFGYQHISMDSIIAGFEKCFDKFI